MERSDSDTSGSPPDKDVNMGPTTSSQVYYDVLKTAGHSIRDRYFQYVPISCIRPEILRSMAEALRRLADFYDPDCEGTTLPEYDEEGNRLTK